MLKQPQKRAARWAALWNGQTSVEHQRVFDRLHAAYTQPARHYHNIDHIDFCLRELDSISPPPGEARTIEIALWFHDVVYDPMRPDNEQRSADVAEDALRQLNVEPATRRRICGLIMDTTHKSAPGTAAGEWIVDIDLAGLAAPADVFDENTRRIRREFAHLSDDAFRGGRGRLLDQLLAKSRIYYTDWYFHKSESAARNNLQRAVDRMGA